MLQNKNLHRRKYFVYRFLNKDGVIIYVGKTINLHNRFKQHERLNDEVSKIEYIVCDSEAEMAWKEIYYINLYRNELTKNIFDVYKNETMADIGLLDLWKKYESLHKPTDIGTLERYKTYVTSVPNYDYEHLIHIVEHRKLNEIGSDKYSISQKWFLGFVKQNV